MSIKPIVQLGHPALRNISETIAEGEILEEKTQTLVCDLLDTLKDQKDGVGLSAPQIGINKRVFVLSGSVLELPEDVVCINPKIIKTSRKKKWMEEGCLSIRGRYGEVERFKTITFTYLDQHGQFHTRGAGGLFCHAVQHENDHLDGILFIDKSRNERQMTQEELDKLLADNM